MSRFSPMVLPQPVNPLAAVLSTGIPSFEQARQAREARALRDATLVRQGIYAPGTDIPAEMPGSSPAGMDITGGPRSLAPAPATGGGGIPSSLEDVRPGGMTSMLQGLPMQRPVQRPPAPAAWTPDTSFAGIVPKDGWGFAARVAPQRFVTTKGGYNVQTPDYDAYQAEQAKLRELSVQEQMRLAEDDRKNKLAWRTHLAMTGQTEQQVPYDPGRNWTTYNTADQTRATQDIADERTQANAKATAIASYSDISIVRRALAGEQAGVRQNWAAILGAADRERARGEVRADRAEQTSNTAAGWVDTVQRLSPDHPWLKNMYNPDGSLARPLTNRDTVKFQRLATELEKAEAKGLGHAPLSAMGISGFTRFTSAANTMAAQNDIMLPIEALAAKDPHLFGAIANAWTSLARYGSQEIRDENQLSNIVKETIGKMGLSNYERGIVLRYTMARARWAFEDGTIQLRGGTDFRVRLDDMVSGMPFFPTPETIADAQEGRRTRLRGYAGAFNPAFDALGRAKTATDMQDYIRILKSGGYTPDDIKQTLIQQHWVMPSAKPAGSP